MKHLSKLFFPLLLALSIHCFAEGKRSKNGNYFVRCPKTYVSSEQITFHENAIYAQIKDRTVQVKTLTTDKQGIFFETALKEDCSPYIWKCKNSLARGVPCRTYNWIWSDHCSTCEEPKKLKSK